MNQKIITINNPQNDSMGASLTSLLDLLEQWNSVLDNETITLDLSKITFLHPFLILPVSVLISEKSDRIIKIDYNSKIESYLETILFPTGFDALKKENWKQLLSCYSRKSYLPICKIPSTSTSAGIREDLLTTFENILLNQSNLQGQLISVIKYLISEAFDNIVEHADSCSGWIMVQNYSKKGYLDICIVDNGLGILGSYLKTGIPGIDNDAVAIERAINGQSTKQITETRGYGIDTSRRMLVEGLTGNYFLLSGKSFYVYSKELEQILNLSGDYGWNGTMLALQIPGAIPYGFNYTTYLE
jgi:anti-sigma regulatory factor (Ser/Thr protein kinase)